MHLGRILIVVGLAIAAAGGVLWLLGRAGIARIPGDLVFERPGLTMVLPIGTCILLSIVLTLLLRWLGRPGR